MKRRTPLMVRLGKFLLGYKLTPIGRIAVLGIFVSAIGAVTIEIPIYQFFCGLICLFGLIEAVGMLLRPNLEVSSWMPERVTAGESVTGYITVKNRGRLPTCDVMCAMLGMPRHLKHLDADRSIRLIPSQETDTLPFSIRAKARGTFQLPTARVHSTFPFNLMRFGKAQIPGTELRVLPRFHPLERLELPFSRKTHVGGISVEARLGESAEYVGNREYVPGEPVRRLDFRAWARVGKPVVREFQDEFSAEIALVLDTYGPSRFWSQRRQREAFEAAISFTAAIAHHIDQRGMIVETFLAGPDLYLFQPNAASTHFESILDVLSEVELTRDDPLLRVLPTLATTLDSIAIVLCVFVNWDQDREQFVRELIDNGCAVRVLVISEEPVVGISDVHDEVVTILRPTQIMDAEVVEL